MTDWVDRAKARMTFLKLTQNDLMDAFGVATRGAVGHYLSRRRSPTPDQLIALAGVLRMTVGELLAGESVAITPEESQRRTSEYRASENLSSSVVRTTVAALREGFRARGLTFDIYADAEVFCALYTVMDKQGGDADPESVHDLAVALASLAGPRTEDPSPSSASQQGLKAKQ